MRGFFALVVALATMVAVGVAAAAVDVGVLTRLFVAAIKAVYMQPKILDDEVILTLNFCFSSFNG